MLNPLSTGTLFDRVIDLSFFSDTGKEIAKINTPKSGPKPDITIKGTMVSQDLGITTDITVTNFGAEHMIEDCSYVIASFGYSGLSDLNRRKMCFSILFADDAKQPPDRQVTFHCVALSQSLSCMAATYKDKTKTEAKEPPLVSISELLNSWVSAYNKEVDKAHFIAPVKAHAKLQANVTVKVDPILWAKTQIRDNSSDRAWSFYQYLQYLNECLSDAVTTSDGTVIAQQMCIMLVENSVQVLPTQYAKAPPSLSAASVTVNHVLAASRKGPILTLRMPFRPDINPGDIFYMSSDLILGRSVAGNDIKSLIKLASGQGVKVYVLPGVQYEFGTVTGQNYMTLKGKIDG